MNLRKQALLASLMLIPSVSFAAIPAGVTTAITDASADVAVLGAAVIIVMVGIKVWKWVQRVL